MPTGTYHIQLLELVPPVIDKLEKLITESDPSEYVMRMRSGGASAPNITPMVMAWFSWIGMPTGDWGMEVRIPSVSVTTS